MIDDSPEFCPAVVVMVKTPRPGKVKTRLRLLLTDEQCASLATCFLQDTVCKVKRLVPNIIIAFSPADGLNELQAQLGENLIWTEQKGNNLGEKMESVIRFAENKNFKPIITIGTDSPTLPATYLESAIAYFRDEKTEIVLGPSSDGGYYLLGLRKMIPGIFENITWSSPQVFDQTIDNANQSGISDIKILPNWFDIDTPQDFLLLQNEFLNNQEARLNAPSTYQWLTAYDLRIG